MLTDAKTFAEVEQYLRDEGVIAEFEAEHGPITGRMLIDRGEVPSTLADEVEIDADTVIFRGSYDFANSTVGIAIDRKTGKPKCSLWMEEQKLGAYQVAEDYAKYFINVLRESIAAGSYDVPIFCFMNEDAAFEIYPAPAEE